MNVSGDNGSAMMSGDSENCQIESKWTPILVYLHCAAASISLTACIVVIVIICTLRKYHSLSQRLILYLAMVVIVRCMTWTTYLIEYHLNKRPVTCKAADYLCSWVGYLSLTVGWMELMAVTCLTTQMLLNMIMKQPRKWMEKAYILAIVILPLMFTWIPFTRGAYGRRDAICWIKTHTNDNHRIPIPFGFAMNILLWFLPLIGMIVYLILLYIRVTIIVKKRNRNWEGNAADPVVQRHKAKLLKDLRCFFWYPFIYFLFYCIPFVVRVGDLVKSQPVYALLIIASITRPLQGGIIAVAFMLDAKTIRRLRRQNISGMVHGFMSSKSVKDYPTTHEQEDQSYGELSCSWNDKDNGGDGGVSGETVRGQYSHSTPSEV